MSAIVVRPVLTKSDEKKFIKFQWVPYRNNPVWVPPLLLDRRKLIDRKGNPFYQHSVAEFFLAERDGEVVGRIGAIVNDNHNKEHGENIGFFGFFECVEDQSVATALFDAATKWLKGKGVTAVRGPASPSVNDEYGMLVDGFQHPPAILMSYNPPYYPKFVEAYGFTKVKDLYSYYLHRDKVFTEKMMRINEVMRKRAGVTVRAIDMKKFDDEVKTIHQLYNRGWSKNWGEVPMTDAEFDYLAKDLKPSVDPRTVLIAETNGKPVGFALGLPDYNIILKHNKHGWLIPAILRIILFKKKINFMRIVTLGVLPEYGNTGIGGLLFYETGRRGVDVGYFQGEASWVNEDNVMMNRGAEMMNGDKWKTHRIYELKLT